MAVAAPEIKNMRLLAQDELAGNGNGGEGIALVAKNGRRYLYIAHECAPVNFTVVDVTDPRRPKVVEQRLLPHASVRSNSLAVSGGLLTVAYQVIAPGLEPAGLEIFSLDDPADPRSIGFFDTSGPQSRGTHCVWFVDGRYAYLSSGMPDSKPTNMLDHLFPVIVDLNDPVRPREVGRWWLPGTQIGDDAPPPVRHSRFDHSFSTHNVNVYPQRPDRAYVGHLDGGFVILDIADKSRPRLVSRLDYHPPMNGLTHTIVPFFDRDLVVMTDEAVIPGAGDYPKTVWIADISVEEKPTIIGSLPLPPKEEYAHRGGRFGAHNLHENEPVDTAWYSDTIVVGAFFSAGVRVYDTSDPLQPKEVAYYVPETPSGSHGLPIQINDVWVDENAIVYAIDRYSGGLYVLEMDI